MTQSTSSHRDRCERVDRYPPRPSRSPEFPAPCTDHPHSERDHPRCPRRTLPSILSGILVPVQITDVQVCGDPGIQCGLRVCTRCLLFLETRTDFRGRKIHNCYKPEREPGLQECIIAGTAVPPHTQNIVSGTITKGLCLIVEPAKSKVKQVRRIFSVSIVVKQVPARSIQD